MIVCTKCSTENANGDEFCGGCGEFLEWAGQKVAAEPPPEPESPAPEPKPVAPEPEAAAPEPEPAEPDPPVAVSESVQPIPAQPQPVQPQPVPPRVTQPEPVQPAPVQPQPVQPQPVQPAAVLPTKPVPQRAEPAPTTAAEPALRPGEFPCPACGAGNEPGRSFCRRCGSSLAAAPPEEAKEPSWWKKLVTKDPKVHAAGDRPMRDKKGKFKP